jgi:hypothetical protein
VVTSYIWIFPLPFVWIAGVIAASIWYRRRKGEPIFPQAPGDAVFAETGCSGYSLRSVFSRIGGASNCLLVTVHDSQLAVTPSFPFNLMFLPEIYGLSVRIPVTAVAAVTPVTSFFRKALRIEFAGGGPAPIELVVRDRDGLARALGTQAFEHGGQPLQAPSAPRKSRRFLRIRLFLAIWGIGALVGGGTGLRQDWRYRHEGVAITATYADPDPRLDEQAKMGVLTYKVAGAPYRLTSLSGAGLFKAGGTEVVYYLPSDPQDGRESGYIYFDLLFFCVGSLALAISSLGGIIARRIW